MPVSKPSSKLMLIAVDVDAGTIDEPTLTDPNPRVVGVVDSVDFDTFVDSILNPTTAPPSPKAKRPHRANTPDEPFKDAQGNFKPATYVSTILHTHNSPGCTWVYINGWPYCIKF